MDKKSIDFFLKKNDKNKVTLINFFKKIIGQPG